MRAVVLDGGGRILLVRIRRVDGGAFWATPGGGVEPGESDLAALRRELAEEIGLHDPDVGPCVWTRDHTFEWHRTIRQHERIYLVRVDRHVAASTVPLADEGVEALRWWTIDELAASPDEFAPRALVAALGELLAGRIPAAPYDVGR